MQLYSLIPLILSISGLPSTGATSRRYDDVARVDLGRLPDGTVTLHVIGYGQGKYYSPYSPPEAHNPHKQKSAWKKLKHGFKKHVTNPLRRLVGLESNKQKLKRTNKMLAEVQKMDFGRRFCSKLDDINKVLRSVDPLATGVAYPECKSKYQMHSTVVVYPINARATAFGVNYGAGSGATSTKIKYKSSSGSTTTKIKQKGSGTGGAHPQTHEPIGQQVQRMVQNMFGKLMSNFQRSHVQPCHSTTTAASPMGGTGAMPVGCNGAPTPMTCTHQPMVSQPTYQHKGRYTLSHHAPQYASPATCGGQKIKIKYTRPATHGTGMPCQQAHPHYKASYKTKMSTPAYQHTTQGTGMSCHQAQPHYKTSYKVKSHGASHQHAGMGCHQAQPHYKTSYKVKTSGTSHQHTGMGCHQAQPHYKTSYKVKTSGAPHQRTGMGCHQAQPHYKTSYKVKTSGAPHQHTGMGCHQAQPHYKTSYKVKTGSSHECHQQISAPSSASYKLKIKSPAYAQQPSAGHHSGHFHQHQHLPCQQITQTHPMSAQLMGSLRAPGGPHYCTPHQIQHASHCHWAHIKHGYSGSHNKNHGRHGKHHQGHATVKLYKNASGKGGTYCVQVVHRHKSAGGPALI